MNYLKNAREKKQNTSVYEPIKGKKELMHKNHDGAYVFKLNELARVKRFLILGSEGGSYYQSEAKLTSANCKTVMEAIKKNGKAVVDLVVEVSDKGLAAKNDPALFVLALCASHGDDATKAYALENLGKVARIPTHLYHFVEFLERGWGRGLKRAVANWFLEKDANKLAYNAVKYQSRDGWGGDDVLKLAHPKTSDPVVNQIFKYMINGWESLEITREPNERALGVLWAVEKIKTASEKETLDLIERFKLPLEAIPTNKYTPKVYEAVMQNAGLTWIVRNLGNLTKHGVLRNGGWDNVELVTNRLTDHNQLKSARVHPLALLVAYNIYRSGRSLKGDGVWTPVTAITDALEAGFYKAFDAVVPSNKRFMVGLDVSGSMSLNEIAGMPGITPAIGTGVLAMTLVRTEPKVIVRGFADSFRDLGIQKSDSLDAVKHKILRQNFGATNMALPMTWAMDNRVEADCFVVMTDGEVNQGKHPSIALENYRQRMGIDAKLVCVGMEANRMSIADPTDPLQLDVPGFSADMPSVITNFAGI